MFKCPNMSNCPYLYINVCHLMLNSLFVSKCPFVSICPYVSNCPFMPTCPYLCINLCHLMSQSLFVSKRLSSAHFQFKTTQKNYLVIVFLVIITNLNYDRDFRMEITRIRGFVSKLAYKGFFLSLHLWLNLPLLLVQSKQNEKFEGARSSSKDAA